VKQYRSHMLSVVALTAVTIAWTAPQSALAQGCILSRQCAPGIGAATEGGAYLKPGEWQISTNYRQLEATRHFNGIREQFDRETNRTFVINKQKIVDINANYAVNDRLNLSLSVPYLAAGSWNVPLPIPFTNPPGPRSQQDSSGLGDITFSGRYWLRDGTKMPKSNMALGLGVKFPTGKDNLTGAFPDRTGGNIAPRPVDQSIQLGDGGWGIQLGAQMFKSVGKTVLFSTGSYLISPRNTNGVPSIRANLGFPTDPLRPSLDVNSVPDQYLFRAGAMRNIGNKGFTASLAWRVEGVPPSDLIGDSDGFRRPGYGTFIEPGLIYSRGANTFSLNIPIALIRNPQQTRADGNPIAGDATFADYILLFNYTRNFGSK
jgi:hypothetical protein